MLPCERAVKEDLFQWLLHRIRRQIQLEQHITQK